MKELNQINDMLAQGKLTPEQAELLADSIRESKFRSTMTTPRELKADESPPAKKIWIVLTGIFLALMIALIFTVKYKPLFFLLLLVVFSFGCSAAVFLLLFNILVWKKEDVTRARALILNEVDRKEALVPQIWDAVSAYAKKEGETFQSVTEARAASSADTASSTSQLDHQIGAIQALVESYPEIKSNQNYAQLFNELVKTENRITAMAEWHNQKVHSFNSTVGSFPFSIVAAAFSFKKAAYFESEL